jgi:hypothetical protein
MIRRGQTRGVGEAIADYQSAAEEPQALKATRQIPAIKVLRQSIGYEREFSSGAEACIRKTVPEAVQAKVNG